MNIDIDNLTPENRLKRFIKVRNINKENKIKDFILDGLTIIFNIAFILGIICIFIGLIK